MLDFLLCIQHVESAKNICDIQRRSVRSLQKRGRRFVQAGIPFHQIDCHLLRSIIPPLLLRISLASGSPNAEATIVSIGIMRKLGIHNLVAMVKYAIKIGIIDPEVSAN